MRPNRTVLEALNGMVFAATVIGANILGFIPKKVPIWLQLTLTVILAAIYFVSSYEKTKTRTYYFQERSKPFVKYFEKWYSQDGTLSIFCRDLGWLDNKESAGIVYQLQQKKDRLFLYLRVVDEKIAKQLGIGGAKVFKIKDAIITPHRLSLLVSDGYKKIIVRNTDLETRKVSFIERDNLSDPYLVGLAEDVLNDCSDWKYPS